MTLVRVGMNAGMKFSVRSITYLHTGARVRGLKRDPGQMLKNPEGIQYDTFKQEHLSKVKDALHLDKYNVQLPDEVILQCLTHKSFAQGIKPYNQKLALVGSHFLKYQAAVYSLSQSGPAELSSQSSTNIINGLNFSNIGTNFSKLLISKEVCAQHIHKRQLSSLIFWNKRGLNRSHKFNGEHTVLQTVLNAFVGSVYMLHGSEKAAEYVSQELLGESSDSLINITKELMTKVD